VSEETVVMALTNTFIDKLSECKRKGLLVISKLLIGDPKTTQNVLCNNLLLLLVMAVGMEKLQLMVHIPHQSKVLELAFWQWQTSCCLAEYALQVCRLVSQKLH